MRRKDEPYQPLEIELTVRPLVSLQCSKAPTRQRDKVRAFSNKEIAPSGCVPTLDSKRFMLFGIMVIADKPPKGISELADRLEVVREELLSIQRSMEKMEDPSSLKASRVNKKR